MKVNEVMTVDPVCCAKSETAQVAAAAMKKLNIGSIPVVEDDKSYKIVGMVTDRDLCLAVVAEGKDPNTITLEECMSTSIICCNSEVELEDALNLMREHQIHRLPVVDDKNQIVGIVSTSDLLFYSNLSANEVDQIFKDIYKGTADLSYFASKYLDTSQTIMAP